MFNKSKKILSLPATIGMLVSVLISSCSSGSCSPYNSKNTGQQYSLSIASPSEYPAGVAVTIPMLVFNNGYSSLNNLVYTVPSSTNKTGVDITINPGSCTNLPAYSSGCTIYANVPAGSNPGSFVVQATSAGTQQSIVSRIENKIGSIFANNVNNLENTISVTANLGLTNIESNNLSGANGITLLYPNTIVANPDGTTTVIITAVISSSNAGEFNTLILVDSNGNPISGVSPISGNSGTGYSNLAQGSIVALSVTLPKGSQQQSFYLQTQKNGVNVSKSSSQNQINIVPSDLPTGVISLQPSSFNLSSAYTKQVITLTNNGNGVATNLDLSVLGGINIISGESTCGATLAVGASCTYTVGFDATKPISGTGSVTVKYQANSKKTVSQSSTVQYTGTDAIAGLEITSSSSNFDFSTTTNSPAESVVITIKNTGSYSESITSITPPAPFSINTNGLTNGCGATPFQLLAGKSCSYNLVYNNSNVTPASTVPYVISYLYKGAVEDKQGSSAVTLNYQTKQAKASLSVSSSNINFPTIVNNNYATYTESIVINNQGNNSATNIAVSMTNIAPNFFSQTNNCPSTLPVGQSCIVWVKFGPVSGNPATSIESINISYTLYTGGNSTTVSSKVTGQVLQAGSAVPTIDPNAPAESSGFSGGTGSQSSPYVVQNNNTPPTLTYTIVNDSTTGKSALGMYISESTLSPGWTLAPGNTCGTKNTPISFEAGKSCNLVLQLATTTTGNYPLDLSTVTANWTDEMNPTTETTTSFNGTVNAQVYAAPLITISPSSTTVPQGESVVVTATLSGGYNVGNNTISLSPSPATASLQISSEPSPCILSSSVSSCNFNILAAANATLADYELVASNSGNVPLNTSNISINVVEANYPINIESAINLTPVTFRNNTSRFVFIASISTNNPSVVISPNGDTCSRKTVLADGSCGFIINPLALSSNTSVEITVAFSDGSSQVYTIIAGKSYVANCSLNGGRYILVRYLWNTGDFDIAAGISNIFPVVNGFPIFNTTFNYRQGVNCVGFSCGLSAPVLYNSNILFEWAGDNTSGGQENVLLDTWSFPAGNESFNYALLGNGFGAAQLYTVSVAFEVYANGTTFDTDRYTRTFIPSQSYLNTCSSAADITWTNPQVLPLSSTVAGLSCNYNSPTVAGQANNGSCQFIGNQVP